MFKSSKAHPLLPRENALHLILLTAIIVITATTFLPVLWNEFVDWDDYAALVQNPRFRGLGWTQLQWMFTTFYLGPYQPLSWMSYAFDYLVWGINPVGYHLTNVMFHAANAAVFYLVSRRLLIAGFSISDETPSNWLNASAALGALLFSIHPLRVESVAWATERRDVLSGFFYLGTLYFYLQMATGVKARRSFYLAILAYGLSLLAKATSMTLPLVLILVDVYPLRRLPLQASRWGKPQFRNIVIEKIPFLCLAALLAVIALLGQHAAGSLQRYDSFCALLLATEPDNAVTHNNLGLLLAIQGRTSEALGHLYQSVSINPNDPMAFFNLGRIFADQGQDEKALENYGQALRLAPTQFEIHLQLGKILERQNHFAEGKKHFEVAMKLKPESAEARWALARSLAKLGLEGEAQKQYEEAIRLLEIQRKFASNGKTKDWFDNSRDYCSGRQSVLRTSV